MLPPIRPSPIIASFMPPPFCERSVGSRDCEFDSFGERGLSLARGEIAERIDRPPAVMTRTFYCVRQGIGRAHELDRLRQVGVRNAFATDCETPEIAVGFASA